MLPEHTQARFWMELDHQGRLAQALLVPLRAVCLANGDSSPTRHPLGSQC
jgi:hypothetical protein